MQPSKPYEFLNSYFEVSHETFDKLAIYYELLIKWQAKINLIGSNTVNEIWQRHFLDSIQLKKYISNYDQKTIDLGSGAGFPGMVLAILGYSHIHLIESNVKKIAFLQEVSRLTKTSVVCHNTRIEEQNISKVKIIISRACTELDKLLEYAYRFVSHETTCLFHKGQKYSKEIEDAKNNWEFNYNIYSSILDKGGVILQLSNIRRKNKDYHDSNSSYC